MNKQRKVKEEEDPTKDMEDPPSVPNVEEVIVPRQVCFMARISLCKMPNKISKLTLWLYTVISC